MKQNLYTEADFKKIHTPDQRLRVFISSTIHELAAERECAKKAITSLKLIPVLFEMGARPHPPRELYSAYLKQSQVFIGIYWEQYGWIAPDMDISGLEDEFRLSEGMPRLIYIKRTNSRSERLQGMINEIGNSGLSYQNFSTRAGLGKLLKNDLAVLLSERFEGSENGRPVRNQTSLQIPLPVSTTPLIGRKEELAEAKQLLLDDDVRLVTLTGTGGIGKTRMALEMGQQLSDVIPGGVAFVQLASIHEPDLLIEAIAITIFPDKPIGLPPMEVLRDGLPDKQTLIVLDNFEHIIAAAPLVSELLSTFKHLKILVTSREALRLIGEHEFQVPPLSLPQLSDNEGAEDLTAIQSSAAVQLFNQRSQAIKPNFKLTEENAGAVAEIVTRLDGIPLAIELAAARGKIFPPRAMLANLGSRLELLEGGARNSPQRHQTMRATIEWSYHLLKPEEQQILRGLSVFEHGCDLQAASAVLDLRESELQADEFPRLAMYLSKPVEAFSPGLSAGFIHHIESLILKSLVYTTEPNGSEMRIYLYLTIKDYASEQLEQKAEAARIHSRDLAYYLNLVEHAWSYLRNEDAQQWFNLIDQNIENIRVCLRWGSMHQPVYALRLAVAMAEYWDTRAMYAEAVKFLSTLLQITEAGTKPLLPKLEACSKLELMRQLFRVGDFERACQYLPAVFQIANTLNDDYLLADALSLRSAIFAFQGKLEQVLPDTEEGLRIADKLGYDMRKVDLLQNLGVINLFQGNWDACISAMDESLLISKKLGAIRWSAIALSCLGFAKISALKVNEAEMNFREGLVLCKKLNDVAIIGYPLLGLAQVNLVFQKAKTTVELIGAVDRLMKKQGMAVVPVVMQLINQTGAATRQQIGDELFEKYLQEGDKLLLNDAIALAEGEPVSDF